MTSLRTVFAALALTVVSALPAHALDPYSEAQTAQFTDWCTGKPATSQSVCSCAVKRLAQTVPASALAAFLADQQGGGGFTMSTTAIATAATVTDALTACAQ